MSSVEDNTGQILGGRYRLLELAGRGGMAEVWRAELVGAAGFRRPVAIKRVLPHLADEPSFRAMFVEEARVSAALDHPNIVQVFDFNEDPTGPFLVLEWVEGASLRDLNESAVERGAPLAPAAAAGIGIELLRALEAAHGHKVRQSDGALKASPIVHRDISPTNVMVSLAGVVKLADFGLARAFDRARLTPDGVIKGKLAYLAPESVRGEASGEAVDLYAVGVVLWETVCGRRLYASLSDGDIVRRLLDRVPPPAVRAVRPEVPAPLAAVIDRALDVDGKRRFGSATQFARALGDALRRLPERSDPARVGNEVAASMLRRRRAAAREESEIPVEYSEPVFPLAPHRESSSMLIPMDVSTESGSILLGRVGGSRAGNDAPREDRTDSPPGVNRQRVLAARAVRPAPPPPPPGAFRPSPNRRASWLQRGQTTAEPSEASATLGPPGPHAEVSAAHSERRT